jgi:RNA polymerase sigma-70 factor (ECF subfamily)
MHKSVTLWMSPPKNSLCTRLIVLRWLITPPLSLAEDVVQEVWLRFDSRKGEYLDLSHPLGYLYRIVRNLALDLPRSIATEKRQPDSHAILDEMASSSASPEREAASRDELRVISQALGELPERTRMAFEMHRLGG